MGTFQKEVDTTFFYKREKTTIEDVAPGDIVCIKVQSPLNYGIRELDYFGRIHKVTKCYFWIIEYLGPALEFAFCPINDCSTSQVKRHDENPDIFAKKWAKSSLIDIWKADLESRVVTKIYGTTE